MRLDLGTWVALLALATTAQAAQAAAQTVAVPRVLLQSDKPAGRDSSIGQKGDGGTITRRTVPYSLNIPQEGPNKTAIDHRFSADGVVGSVGYLCGQDVFVPGASGGGGPASTFGHFGTFLGARLGYAFK